MNRKTTPAQIYIPSSAKHIAYYPIEVKKSYSQLPQEHSKLYHNMSNLSLRAQRYKDREVGSLRRLNQELKQREQAYVEKLMELEQALFKQHTQFVKLQKFYTELFQSYKLKQAEIAALQHKFRETDQLRQIERMESSREIKEKQRKGEGNWSKERSLRDSAILREQEIMYKETDWLMKQNQWKLRENQLIRVNEKLLEKIVKLAQKHQKITQEANKPNQDPMMSSKAAYNQRLVHQLQHLQTQFSLQKELRLKFQFQNQFLKSRNKDLEKRRQQLQQLVTYKQSQILKLKFRHEINSALRQQPQKAVDQTPYKGMALKAAQPVSSFAVHEEQEEGSLKLRYSSKESSDQQQKNGQYFSFSQDKQQSVSQLPDFPAELEIDSLIKQHKKE